MKILLKYYFREIWQIQKRKMKKLLARNELSHNNGKTMSKICPLGDASKLQSF